MEIYACACAYTGLKIDLDALGNNWEGNIYHRFVLSFCSRKQEIAH